MVNVCLKIRGKHRKIKKNKVLTLTQKVYQSSIFVIFSYYKFKLKIINMKKKNDISLNKQTETQVQTKAN